MAEFKLGRIRFVYQGQWTTGTPYVVDDVVSIGGKTYICVLNHTAASAFETDQTFNPTRWNVVADGSKWRDGWTAATHYDLGDQVKWGGTVYICNTAHTSSTYSNPTYLGLEDNIENWDVFATTTSWEGAWVTGKRYKVRDLVSYGGTTYICNAKHISAATAAEGLELDILKWDVFNQGITYTGAWLGSTRYKLNDIVRYGADLWICTIKHTSATDFDNSKFAIFVNGFQFENSWSDTTDYQLGDIVTYGGYTYTALQNHTDKTPSTETAYWQPFTTGFNFQGDWNSSSVYLIGSVVRLGGYTYVANLDNAAQTVTVSGTTISSDLTRPNQITIDEDTSVLVQNLPISFATNIGGLVAGTTYYVKTIVDGTHFTVSATAPLGVAGSAFTITSTTTGQSVVATTDPSPPFTTYWSRLNSGIKWNASSETYTGISGTNIVGTGTSATFNVVRQGTVYAVTRNAVGSGYAPTDTIKILGTQVGGLSPANDITITVGSVSGGQISTITSTGISVTWSTGLTYVLGDVVFFGASSYICVAAHVAASGNRPDADTSATYWNLMASGSESAVLTTQGDMFYFGQNGAQRLPVGTDGQVLRVSGTAPAWSYYGIINNVVYVAPTGSNTSGNGQGLTIDKPWQSVRYAAKQIEDGYLNTNTRDLLKKNKQFLLKEINNYILNTFKVTVTGSSTTTFTTTSTAGIYIGMPISFTSTNCGVTVGTTYYVASANFSDTGFSISTTSGGNVFTLSAPGGANTGSYVYSQSKTERDTGYAIEGLIYDISHGGTLQTTTNALAYYSTANTSAYISGVISGDITAFASAMTYLSTLVGNVLSNTAPATNYQTTSGITTDAQATQVIDLTLTPETGTATTASNLIAIIKNGLLAGSSTAIATAIQPNTTISVKTGTYNEVLPIVVPRNTAIVGDELRSTVIQPQAAIANLVNDKPKSIAALNRVKSAIPSIISNIPLVATAGNTQSQQYLFTSGLNTATTRVNSNIAVIKNIVASGLSATPTYVLPTPTSGTGNASDAGYLNAARLVYANKAFLQAEVSAWIDAQIAANTSPFSGFVYAGAGRTKCERDVGYIVDALRYDLTYGGNLATVIAARSYYSNGVLVEVGEKAQAKAVELRIKDIIDNIITGNTAGWTKTPANVLTQDVSGSAGSAGAATFAQARIQEIHDTIDTGTSPTTIAPGTTWVASALTTANTTIQEQKAGIQASVMAWIYSVFPNLYFNASTCSRDVGYMIDALCYDMMFGSNFLSSQNGMSYYRSLTSTAVVLASQLQATLGTISTLGSYVKEITAGTSNVNGSLIATSRVVDNATLMYDIVNNGISNVPAFVFTPVTGYNTSFLAGFGDGKAQLVQNYAFIKDEVSSYLNTNYNGVWTALGATGQANCQRDVGYILDALQYDMTYGGNVQTLIVGSSYYSNYALTIGATEKTATIAAYGWLKDFIDNVIIANTAGWTKNTSSSQVTSGTAGSAGAGAFAQDRIQDIIDWITNGTAPATVLPTAAIALTSTSLQTAYNSLQAARTEIQADTTAWVKKFFQSMPFTESTCYRDAGLIVDALSYDLVFGSNFNSITVGRSYARATTSAQVVINSQKAAELGAINFIKYKAKHLAAGGGLAMATNAITDITNFITGGGVPRPYWPDFSSISANTAAAAKIIWANKAFIQAEVIQYITTNYPSVVYSQATCARDVGYIIDALRYDLTYGGKFASKQVGISYYSRLTNAFEIAAAEKIATLAAYGQLKTIVQALAQGGSYSALQTQVAKVTGTAGSATEATAVGALVDVITGVIDNGLTTGVPRVTITAIATNNTFTAGTHGLSAGDEVIPQSTANGLVSGTTYYVISAGLTSTQFRLAATWGGTALATFTNGTGLSINAEISNLPAYSWVPSDLQTEQITLSAAKATIQSAVISYINTNFPALTYNNATCSRDVGYIIDAIGYDFMMNSNFRSIKAGMSYYQAQAALVVGSQKAATIAAFNYLKTQIASQISDNATAVASANSNMDVIINILSKGIGETPEVHGSVTYNNTLGTIKAAELLRANKTFLAYEAASYISTTYTGTVTSTATSGNVYTTTAAHNFTVGDPVAFTGTAIASSGVTIGTQYYVLTVPSATTFTLTATQGSTTPVVISANGSGSMVATYSYSLANCLRDTTTFVEAIVYDLEYAGNYKSLRAAKLYNNAVSGSSTEDMFLIRNGTGLRNCTLSGLVGTLTNENQYGTKRPTAGAFVALDPGFGPNDTNVWIISRSHYSQNVTMFGTGCTGAKIDAALHTGGNKSMVKNDFTTIISDGIGVWVTGAGSLTELVSVFNYYGYAGYLAELGGRIRATNGNSSYGTYGVIAEGVDTYETPIYATVDNRANQAQITAVVTDAANKILRFEYGNAGQGYTNSVPSISGSGYNATAIQDEFRDAGVFETRLVDLNDSNGTGGTSYVTSSNTSQGGAAGYITIAATDASLSNAYPGMRIQITAGTGVGQYANILTYNNGTKVANIYKDSFTTLTITATSNGSPSTVTVASTGTLYANMPFYVGTTVGGLTAGTLYYVKTIIGGTTFSVSSTSGGTAFTSEITTTTGQSVSLYAAGWDHVIPGFTVTNGIDLTSTYIIEPRISYTAPGYTATARTMSATAQWSSATYGAGRFVAIANGSTSTSYSTDGKTWSSAGALPSTTFGEVVYGGGEGAVATAIVGGLGGSGAQLTAVLGTGTLATQIVGVTVVNGGFGYTTAPTIVFTSGSGSGATATCTVLNGAIAGVTMTINGSGYLTAPTVTAATDRITGFTINSWGRNYFSTPTVTVSGGGSSNQATGVAVLTNAGVSSITVGNSGGSGYTSQPTVTILDTSARYLAISTSANNSAYQTVAGLASPSAWTAASSTAKTNLYSLTYGGGTFVAVGGASGTATCVQTTDGGTTWNDRSSVITPLVSGYYSTVAYGAGTFVAINNGALVTSYSANGVTWTAGGSLPSGVTTTVSSAYGNGRFVTLGSDGKVAYSTDLGLTWTASPTCTGTTTSVLSSSYTWTRIKYGQGLFTAIASGSVAATSPDGINWTTRNMSASSSWKALAFGNPSNKPIWIAASNTSSTIGTSIVTGATALGRVKVAGGSITEIRMIEPGSNYPAGTVSSIGSSNVINVDNTTNLFDLQPITFVGTNTGGITTGTQYFVIGSTIVANTSFKVASSLVNAGLGTAITLTASSVSGMTWFAGPIATQTDPNKVKTAATHVRAGAGVLGNPSFNNRGLNNTTATASTQGDGYSDLFQPSTFINLKGLYSLPQAGANVEFASIPGVWFKLVTVSNVLGTAGNYTATFQINPSLSVLNAPPHNDQVTTRLKYSQVRLTGHDFLYIGTGGKERTNYPYVDATLAIQANQSNSSGGGRVFFTSTDQDGNFNVGNLFGVQQATGTATLNASAFNLSGLQSLQLGAVTLGIGSAIITQFSTDPYFTANSDNVVPTQKAIKSYITAQIGGGSSSLNVNTLTSGVLYLANNTISTTSGIQIKVTSKMNFVGGIDGAPVALGFFMQK